MDEESDEMIASKSNAFDSSHRSRIDFCGSFTADNILNNVSDVDIAHTTIVEKNQDDDVLEQKTVEISYDVKPKLNAIPTLPSPSLTMESGNHGSSSMIVFHGDVKVKNMVGNSRNIRVNHQMMYRESSAAPGTPPPHPTPPTEQVVDIQVATPLPHPQEEVLRPTYPIQAESEFPFSTQVQSDLYSSHARAEGQSSGVGHGSNGSKAKTRGNERATAGESPVDGEN